MKAREIMTPNPAWCAPWDPVTRAVTVMAENDCGCVPIVDPANHRIAGLLTDRDVALRVIGERLDPVETIVADVMSRGIVCCSADHDLESIEEIMRSHHVRRVPIVDRSGRLVGIITLADLAIRIFGQRSLLDAEGLALTLERLSEPATSPKELGRVSDCTVVSYKNRGMRIAL